MFALVHGSIFKASGNFPYAWYGMVLGLGFWACLLAFGIADTKAQVLKYYLSLTLKLKANVCHTSVYTRRFLEVQGVKNFLTGPVGV